MRTEAKKTSYAWILLLVVAVSSWGIWKYQIIKTAHVNYLQVSTSSPAIGQNILPEQRIKFAKEFEKLFHKKDMDAKVTTHGDNQTIVTISGPVVVGPIVHGLKDNVEVVKELREMGFKHLIMTDGKSSWDIDLKN
jgi:hypothetical protein